MRRIVCLFLVFSACNQPQAPRERGDIDSSANISQSPMAHKGIWLARQEALALPMSGPAWSSVLAVANQPFDVIDVGDQDDRNDVRAFAKGLLYVRTGISIYRNEVRAGCMTAIDTELDGGGKRPRTLPLGRNLLCWVIAADLARLEAGEDARFKAWLNRCLTEDLGGRTLISTQEDRPNNWGSMCGASRAAVARYLRNISELVACAKILHAFVGDRSSHTGFTYSLEAFTWMPDPDIPRPINPLGASIHGFNVGGAVVDDISRGGPFQWPPIRTGYPWEGLAGAYACAEILQRAGYPAYAWENDALRRGIDCLWDLHTQFPLTPSWWNDDGDEQWVTWLANKRYGASYEVYSPVGIGKNMGFTDWTHR